MTTQIPTVEDITKSGIIKGNDGVEYKLGSPEATAYLLESSKKLTDPTIGSVYKDLPKVSTPDANVDQSIDQGLSIYGAAANTPIDEGTIRRTTLDRFQKEVDATNSVYDELLSQARIEGRGRLGSARSIAARSGTLGSDFGAAQKEKVLTANRGIENSIQAERSAKLAAIFNQAETAATNEIAAKRQAQKEGLDSYLKFLGAKTERKTANLGSLASAFIDQGIDPNSVDPESLKKLAQTYGVSVDEVLSTYTTKKKESDAAKKKAELETAKAEADLADKRRFTVNEGDAIYELQADGSYKYLGKNPKTSAPGSGSKITVDSAKKLGLPLSVVGQTQDDVVGSLQSTDVPAWFVEKAEKEAQQNLLPEYIAQLWEDYRKKINSNFETGDDDITSILNALGQ